MKSLYFLFYNRIILLQSKPLYQNLFYNRCWTQFQSIFQIGPNIMWAARSEIKIRPNPRKRLVPDSSPKPSCYKLQVVDGLHVSVQWKWFNDQTNQRILIIKYLHKRSHEFHRLKRRSSLLTQGSRATTLQKQRRQVPSIKDKDFILYREKGRRIQAHKIQKTKKETRSIDHGNPTSSTEHEYHL